jgi:hypothetical protein
MRCEYCGTKQSIYSMSCTKCGAPTSDSYIDKLSGEYEIVSVGGDILTRYMVDNAFEKLYTGKRLPVKIVTDAWGMRKISDFYEGYLAFEKCGDKLCKRLFHPISGQSVIVDCDADISGGNMLFVEADGDICFSIGNYSVSR